MKKIFLLICLFFITRPLFAQTVNIDSLIKIAVTDTGHKVNNKVNKDNLLKLLPAAKSPASRIKLIYEIIDYGHDLSIAGLRYHYKILEWAKKHNDPICEAVISAEIGFNFYENGDSGSGTEICLNALKLAEKTGNNQAIGIAYDNLSICYGRNSLSKYYLQKALQFSKAGADDLYVGFELANLGNISHVIDSARYFTSKAFEWSISKHLYFEVSHILLDLSAFQKDSEKLKYIRAANQIAVIHNDRENIIGTQLYAGIYFLRHNHLDSALFYLRKAYNAKNNQATSLRQKLQPTFFMSKVFKHNADSILKYTLEYYGFRDSLQNIDKMERIQSMAFAHEQNRHEIEIREVAYQTRIRYYILAVVIAFAFILTFVFWRNNRRSKQANALLQEQKEQVQQTLHELKQTQTQLIQSEKMASLGELTAGVAHEIQNPLNFVNNFAEVSMELLDEMETELKTGDRDEAIAIASDVKQNLEKIRHHGQRADSIVKGMLQHSRSGSTIKEPTDINLLADEYLRLAYHGLRAKDKSFNAELVTNFDGGLPLVNIVPQDIGRVLLNLFTNAFYAVQQKQKTAPGGYRPTIEISTTKENGQVIIKVKDNGMGIPDAIKDKILQPFFTTKPTGEGTGLGLSMSYDIVVKGHGGKIDISSEEGNYTVIVISIPA